MAHSAAEGHQMMMLPTAYYPLPTAYCPLPAAHCPLLSCCLLSPLAHCPTHHLTPTAPVPGSKTLRQAPPSAASHRRRPGCRPRPEPQHVLQLLEHTPLSNGLHRWWRGGGGNGFITIVDRVVLTCMVHKGSGLYGADVMVSLAGTTT